MYIYIYILYIIVYLYKYYVCAAAQHIPIGHVT